MNNVIVRRQLIERLAAVFYHYIIRCTITMTRLYKALYVKYKITKLQKILTRSEKSSIIMVEIEEFEYSRKGCAN